MTLVCPSVYRDSDVIMQLVQQKVKIANLGQCHVYLHAEANPEFCNPEFYGKR